MLHLVGADRTPGKTTLISLLAMCALLTTSRHSQSLTVVFRSEHLTEGKILINGVSIADYAPSELLQHIVSSCVLTVLQPATHVHVPPARLAPDLS